MLQALQTLIALQALDTAAENARRRLAELPAAEQAIDRKIAGAQAVVDTARTAHAENQRQRRELEKQVAAVDARLARFDDHKAAVKTNHEYTALLHEIATAKSEKDGIEEQILVLMEDADGLQASVKDTERVVATVTQDGQAARTALVSERRTLETDLARLAEEKAQTSASVDKAILARYEQLLKQRKMVAVAEMQGELCTACHVRLRPAVTQQVRRNSDLVACDSCQRILYFRPAPADAAAAPPA
ncbi:MAG: C4-type zinc ribbon domain-containing protein [Acidobacteriota bacterium]